jgi:hypothetical protein
MGLFNSTILDVIIGLIFVYLLLSILCTAANEWVAALTRWRGEMLRKGIHQLLENQPTRADSGRDGLLREFYKHPLITSIMHDKNHPTYISPRTFAAVVTDLFTAAKPGTIVFEDLEAGAKELPDGQVKQSVLALVQRSNKQLEVAQDAIEGWFNDAMDRVSGWYKRRTQVWTLVIALVLTLLANADTVQIVRRLWQDPVLRAAVVEEAKVRAQKPRPTVSVEYKDEDDPTNPTVTRNEGNELSGKERELLGQLIGWHGPFRENLRWSSLLGWLLTVLALSMGAPFWFDLLNKFMNIRFAGKSPDETSKKPEKSDAKVRA